MLQFTTSAGPSQSPGDAEKRGDLLEMPGRRPTAYRRVVTAVRFRGVDEPSSGNGESLRRAPAADRSIAEQATPLARLAADAARQGRETLRTLEPSVRRSARAFRLHNLAHARTLLSEVLQTCDAVAALVGALAQARGTRTSTTTTARRLPSPVDALRLAVASLVKGLDRQDWTTVAVTLEDSLAPALARWKESL